MVYTQERCGIWRIHRLSLNGVSKQHGVQHRNGLLPVGIILDGGGSVWSEDEVLRVLQGILGPLVPCFSVRIKVVDEINEGYSYGTTFVKIGEVSTMRLKLRESVDRAREDLMNEGCTYRAEIG
jgi:hypothetical protein